MNWRSLYYVIPSDYVNAFQSYQRVFWFFMMQNARKPGLRCVDVNKLTGEMGGKFVGFEAG